MRACSGMESRAKHGRRNCDEFPQPDPRNVVRSNTGVGISTTGSGTTYSHNTINSNSGGTVSGALINMGGNSCNETASCP